MTYSITAYNVDGEKIANLGIRGNMASARQVMLDHSNTTDLPTEDPWFGPAIGVLEGWSIGRTEYLTEAA